MGDQFGSAATHMSYGAYMTLCKQWMQMQSRVAQKPLDVHTAAQLHKIDARLKSFTRDMSSFMWPCVQHRYHSLLQELQQLCIRQKLTAFATLSDTAPSSWALRNPELQKPKLPAEIARKIVDQCEFDKYEAGFCGVTAIDGHETMRTDSPFCIMPDGHWCVVLLHHLEFCINHADCKLWLLSMANQDESNMYTAWNNHKAVLHEQLICLQQYVHEHDGALLDSHALDYDMLTSWQTVINSVRHENALLLDVRAALLSGFNSSE